MDLLHFNLFHYYIKQKLHLVWIMQLKNRNKKQQQKTKAKNRERERKIENHN
jgi:hypothetical protein